MNETIPCVVGGHTPAQFHRFGQTPCTDDGNNTIGMREIAVVEYEDGQLAEVPVSMIRLERGR